MLTKSRWYPFLLLISSFISTYPVYVSADDNRDKAEVSVKIDDNGLTLEAHATSLHTVLQALQRKLEFQLVLHGDFTQFNASWSFQQLPLTRLLKQLLGDNHFVSVYNEQGELTKLFAFAKNGGSDSKIGTQLVTHQTDAENRLLEVERLTGLNSPDVLEELGTIIKQESDRTVRLRAIQLLDEYGKSASPTLESGLGDEDPVVRAAVVKSLARLGTESAILAIGQTIVGDKNSDVRRAAVSSLDGLKGGAAQAFVNHAKKDPAPSVRKVAETVMVTP